MPTLEELIHQTNLRKSPDQSGEDFKIINGKKVAVNAIDLTKALDGTQLSNAIPDSPISTGEDFSKYDFPIYPGQDANETAALNQTPWDLAKGAMGNFAGSAAASAGGLAGFIAGVPATLIGALEGEDAPTAISNLYDNPVNKVFSDFQNYMREVVPVYKTKEMQERPWYTTLLAPEFWADEGASGLGYFAGAWASGLAAGAAVSKFMPGMIRGNVEALKLVNGTQGATEAGLNLATKVDDVSKALLNVKNFKNTNIISQFAVGMTMAAGEASAEANGVKEEITNKLKADRQAGLNNYSDEEIETEASKGGNWDFAVNLPIIAVTDMLMFTKQLSGGVKSAQLAKAEKIKGMMQEVAGTAEKTGLAKLLPDMEVVARKPWLERAIRFGTGFGEEGSQEWAQYIAQTANTDYYTSREDVRARKQTLGLLGAYIDTIEDKAFDKEAILSTLLGGLMGGPTQVLTGRKARKDEYEQAKRAADLVSSKNIASHLANIEGITQMMAASNQADEAVLANDEMMARTFRHTALMAFVRNAEENGVGDMLVERIAQLKNVPADKLKEFFNLNDKTDFTEQDKIAYLDKMSAEVKRGRDTWRDISAKWPTLSTAIKDTIYDSIVSRDNLDDRQKKIADKINNLIMTKFPGVVPPFDFNEYMQLAAKTKSEGGEMLDDDKQTVSTWKKTAKDWIGFIKNSNPEVYEEIKKDLNDLFRISDLREVYVKNFNEALKDPEKFEYTAEKQKKVSAIIESGRTQDDIDFYNEHTNDDTVPDSYTEGELVETGAEPNVYEGPDTESPWTKVEPTPNTQIQPKLTERKPGEKIPGGSTFGFTSSEFEAELPDGTKVKVSLIKDSPGFFTDGTTQYKSSDLKNIKVLRDVRKVRTDILNTARKKILQQTFDKNKKQLESLTAEIEDTKALIDDIKTRLLDKRRKKISAKTASAAIAKLEAELEKHNERLATAIKLRDELVAEQDKLITDLNTNVVLEELGFLRTQIASLTSEIKTRNEIIENLKQQPAIIQKLIDNLKRAVKGGYTALYNIYTKTYKTAPVNDQKAWDNFKRLNDQVSSLEIEILEEENFLDNYPQDDAIRKPQVEKINNLKNRKKTIEDTLVNIYGRDAWTEAQSILTEKKLIDKGELNKIYQTIPLPVKQKIEHLIEAGVIPADIARRLNEISVSENEIKEIEDAVKVLEDSNKELQDKLDKTKEFQGKLLNEIKVLTRQINTKPAPKSAEDTKKDDNTPTKDKPVETEIIDDNKEAWPDSWKKSIMDIFSTTSIVYNEDGSIKSNAQKRWVDTIAKIDVRDKYKLKLVTAESNPELFDVDNKSNELLHATDSKGNPTIGVILYKNGKAVGKDLGEVTNAQAENLIYTSLHQPKFEHTGDFGEKFHDAYEKDGVTLTKKAELQMQFYQKFYDKIIAELKDKKNITVDILSKSNGIFKKLDGKRTAESDTTSIVYDLLGKDYNSAEIFVATDPTGSEIIEMETSGRKISLKRGLPYLKLKNGNIIQLASRKLVPDEINTIFDLLKIASTGKTQFTTEGKIQEFEKPEKTAEKKKKESDGYTVMKYFKNEKGLEIIRYWNDKTKKWNKSKAKGKAYYALLSQIKKLGKENEGVKVPKLTKSKTKAKPKIADTSDQHSIYNYIKSVIYYGIQVKRDADGKVTDILGNSNEKYQIYNYSEKNGVKSEVYDKDPAAKNYLVFGNKTIEFTPEELTKNSTELKDFLAEKVHHVKSAKAKYDDKKPFYNITGVNADGTEVTIEKYNNYKDYLLRGNKPGETKDGEKRDKKSIPLTTPIQGSVDEGLFLNMYLTFDPKNQIGKVTYKEEEKTEEEETEDESTSEKDASLWENMTPLQRQQKVAEEMAGNDELIKDTAPSPENFDKALGNVTIGKKGKTIIPDEDAFAMEAFPSVVNALDQKFEKINLDEAEKNIKKILPQVTLRRVLHKLINERYYGISSQAGITLSELATKGTEYHEAFHIVSRGILSPVERGMMYLAAKELWSVPTAEQIAHLKTIYPNQLASELVESFYEEKLAEAFREYMLTGSVEDITTSESKKSEQAKSILEKIFKMLKDLINSVFKRFGANIDTENTPEQKNDIVKLFETIKSGGFSNRPVKNFKSGETRFSTYTPNITAKLNQDVMASVASGFLKEYLREHSLSELNAEAIKDSKFETTLNNVVYDVRYKLKVKRDSLENRLDFLNKKYPDNQLDFDKYSEVRHEKVRLANDIKVLDIGIAGLGKEYSKGEFEYSKTFRIAFDNYLRNYGFEFRANTEDGEMDFTEQVDAQDSSGSLKDTIAGGKAFLEVGAKSTASNAVKLFIASLNQVEKKKISEETEDYVIETEAEEYTPRLGYYGLEQVVDWRTTSAFLFNQLAGLYEYDKLMEKLKVLSALKPELQEVYDYFNKPSTSYYDKKLFQQAFYNTKPTHVTYLADKNGKLYNINSVVDTAQEKIKEKWVDNLYYEMDNNPTSSFFTKDKQGRITMTRDKSGKALMTKVYEQLEKKYNTSSGATDFNLAIPAYAGPLGINFSDINSLSDKSKVLNSLRAIYNNAPADKINSPEELLGSGKFDETSKNVNQTSRVNFLASEELINTVEEISHEFRGPDGELRYALHRPSFINKFVDAINTTSTREELFATFPHLNTFAAKNTAWFRLGGFLYDEEGKRTGNVFKSSFFSGMENTESDYGETTVDLSKPERIAMYFNAAFPNENAKDKTINMSTIWNSDKSLSNGFIMSPMYSLSQFESGLPKEVVDQFVSYLRYDFERNKLLTQQGIGEEVQYYANKTKQLGIFNELFNNVPALKVEADYFLSNNYTDVQIEKFINSKPVRDLLTGFIKNKVEEDKKLLVKYNVITEKNGKYDILGGKKNVSPSEMQAMLDYFAVHSMITNMEQLISITGDINYYKSVINVFKTFAAFSAPKHFAPMSEQDNAYLAYENNKALGHETRDDGKLPDGYIDTLALDDFHTEEFNMKFIEDVLNHEYKDFKNGKALSKMMADKYRDMNEADGMGIMTLPEYREWKQRTGTITPKFEAAYKKAFAGEPLSSADMVYFQPQKLHVGGFQHGPEFLTKDPSTSIGVPVIFKFAVFPIIPSVHKQANTMLQEYAEKAMSLPKPIGMFVVGPKVGAVMQKMDNGKFKMAQGFTVDETAVEPTALLDPDSLENVNLMKVPYNILGMQVKVKDKPEDSGILGVQYKKVIQGNLSDKGEIVGISMIHTNKEGVTEMLPPDKDNTKNVIRTITDSLTDMVIVGQDNLIKDLGLEEIPETKEHPERRFKIKNWKTTISLIRDRLMKAGVSNYVLDTVNFTEDDSTTIRYEALNPLDAVVNRNRIENILMSLINSEVLNPHVVGGARIMSSTIMTDSSLRAYDYSTGKVKSSEDLLNYRKGIHDETLPAQIKIPLPKKYKYLAMKYGSLANLNNAIAQALDIENRYKPENQELLKLITTIAYRIPTQSLNSIDFFEIKEFLLPEAGSVVYAPSAIVTKTGGDFDVDKLNFIFPSWDEIAVKEEKDIEYVKKDQITEEFNNFAIDYFKKELGDKQGMKFRKKLSYFKHEIKRKIKVLDDNGDVKKDRKGKIMYQNIYETYSDFKGLVSFMRENKDIKPGDFTDKEIALFEDMRDAYIKLKKSDIKFNIHNKQVFGKVRTGANLPEVLDYNIQGAAVNSLIEASIKILSSPDMAGELINPNNTINLTELSGEIESVYKIDKEVTDRSKMLSFAFQMTMADQFLAGKAGVGGAVLNQNNHILAQHAGLKVNPKYKVRERNEKGEYVEVTKSADLYFNGFENNQDYSLGARKDIKNENKILNVISEYINGYVDAIKDTFIFSINAGLDMQGVHMYLLRRRVPIRSLIYFMNQPVLRKYTELLEINKNELLESSLTSGKIIDDLIDFHSKELLKLNPKEDRANNYLTEKAMHDVIHMFENKSLEDFSKEDMISYHKMQLQVIKNFKDYKEQAELLQNAVVSMAIDTRKSKSLEENYVYNYMFKDILPEDSSKEADEERGNLINSESLHRLVNNSYLSIYREVQKEVKELLSDMFITSDDTIKNVITDILHPYLDDRFVNSKKKIKVAEKLKTELLTFIFHTQPSNINKAGDSISISQYANALISPIVRDENTSEESGKLFKNIRKLITAGRRSKDTELRYIYDNNSFLKELSIVVETKNFKTEGLKVLNKKRLPHEEDVLIEDFNNLFSMTDVVIDKRTGVTIAQVATSIALASILQSGISYSPYSFINKLPPQRYSNLIGKTVKNFKNSTPEEKAESLKNFKDQFYRNNYKDSTLVPTVKNNFFGQPAWDSPKITKSEYVKKYNRALEDYDLYKAQKYDAKTKTYSDYVEIPKLGDSVLYKEYSIKPLGYSMLPENNLTTVGQDKTKKLSLKGLGTIIKTKEDKSGKIELKKESKNIKLTGEKMTYKSLSKAQRDKLILKGVSSLKFNGAPEREQRNWLEC